MSEKNETLAQSKWATVIKKTVGAAEYLTMATAPAACVLLYDECNNVYLIRQSREDTGGSEFLITIGGYLSEGETHEECVVRNLAAKAGVAATEFVQVSKTYGYGDVVKVPIKLYLCGPGKWKSTHQGTCELVKLPVAEAVTGISDSRWYDDATRLLVLLFAINHR